MERIAALLALTAIAVLPSPALAQQTTVAPVAAPAPGPPAAPVAAVPVDELALGEQDMRMTVPVSIAGKGSWPFVIDTGAERTIVSNELAARLALTPGRAVRVMTMTGTVVASTALVPMLRLKSLTPDTIEAPTFARANMGAIGMLGIDALQGHSVAIDFDRGRMKLKPTKRRSPRARARDEIVIVARSLYGQLIVTDARWRGRKIAVVVDTGSPVTIANPTLLRIAKRRPPPLGKMSVIAPSGDELLADVHRLDRLEIGGVGFEGVTIAVADVAPFARFGLGDTPALLLGMETLRLFRRVEIDFVNRAIRLTMPRGALVGAPGISSF